LPTCKPILPHIDIPAIKIRAIQRRNRLLRIRRTLKQHNPRAPRPTLGIEIYVRPNDIAKRPEQILQVLPTRRVGQIPDEDLAALGVGSSVRGGVVAAAGVSAVAACVEATAVSACETGFVFAVFADKDLAAHEGLVGECLDCPLGLVSGGEFDDSAAFGHAVRQHQDLCMHYLASCPVSLNFKLRPGKKVIEDVPERM
jgi:hypothetical protein